jgi:kexin
MLHWDCLVKIICKLNFDFADNTFKYKYKGGEVLESLTIANRLYESGKVIYACPNWLRSRSKRATPDDPLYSEQWHLENTGQGGGSAGEDVDIRTLWDSYVGSTNEVVAIVDDGIEIDHEDLSANVIAGKSWDYVR